MQDRVLIGRVLKYVPAYNYYHVQVEGRGQVYTGIQGFGGGGLAGTRVNTAITPNTQVLVYDLAVDNPGESVCYILGSLTPTAREGVMAPADQDAPNTGVGFLHDPVFNYPAATDPARDGLAHAGNQTSIDALPGEYTVSNPIGPALHIGYFLAQLRASDRAAIQCFRDGELVRVLGKEYQLHTGVEEVEHISHEGEVSSTRRVALLPWEAMGAFEPEQAPAKQSEEDQDNPDSPPTAPVITTQQEDQRGIFRYHEYTGYLGDIQHKFVEVPTGGGVDQYSKQDGHLGVFHQHLGADGSLSIQSAKSISLEKWNLIPIPLQIRDPHDPSGDTSADYRPSGVLGEGPENPREDFGFAGREDAAAHGMLGLELHGFAGDRMGLANLRAHTKDLVVEEESALAGQAGSGGLYQGFRLDPEVMWMPLPQYREVVVQKGRWEKVRYYASRSAIQQLDDGSIVLEDGYGSQLIMSGGNITITCPGDLMSRPGRSSVTLAPQDVVVRAGNSMDLTTSRRDIRLKAERNLEILGANSGQGGVVIESRNTGEEFDFSKGGEGKDIQGLQLRAMEGTVAVLSKNLAISGIGEGTSLIQTDGTMVVRGKGARVEAQDKVSLVCGQATDGSGSETTGYIFGQDRMTLGVGGAVTAVLNLETTTLQGNLVVQGTLKAAGLTTLGSGLEVSGSIQGSSDSITPMSRTAKTQIANSFTASRGAGVTQAEQEGAELNQGKQELLELAQGTNYFNATLAGTDAEAGLRTDEDYGTRTEVQFVLPEARWQQLARLSGSGRPWDEPLVEGKGGNTAPWPGQQAWAQDSRLLQYEEVNFQAGPGATTPGQQGKVSIVPITRQVLAQAYLGNSKE